ncbi:class I SAM-dependent methyltransferase [Streptomyces sp. CA-249302]|uniref:class I SAM-dependent methyltransferase n=1 Tax=Streptomyces sp. CA-249302 TaxID=3240058 RepID=UPI003D8D7A2D
MLGHAGLGVLDIGCGAGHYIAELRARGAAEVVGVEGSATLLGHARDMVGRDAAVTLHHHDLEEPLDFLSDDSFDLAVAALVHHHSEDRTQLLAELHRVLRPGGTLLLRRGPRRDPLRDQWLHQLVLPYDDADLPG